MADLRRVRRRGLGGAPAVPARWRLFDQGREDPVHGLGCRDTHRRQLLRALLARGTDFEQEPATDREDPGGRHRQVGARLSGGTDTFNWEAGLWEAGIDADTSTIAFGSQVDSDQDYEGQLVGARVEIHPGGDVKFGQGNPGGTSGWEIGLNGFAWSNDDDRRGNIGSDYDSVNGFGIDGAWRHGGWSVDAEANTFSAETRSGSFNGGIVENGDADVQTTSVEGGYMIVPHTWEIVVGLAAEEADTWDETETQAGIGVNHFISGNSNKLQVSLVQTADENGTKGDDVTDLYVQLQHAF